MFSRTSFTDRALAQRIRIADAHAFEILFRRYSATLFRFTVSLTRDPHLAEDIVQDIFSGIWTRRTDWEIPDDILAYLIAAARKGVLYRLRATHTRTQKAAYYVPPGTSPAHSDPPVRPDDLTERLDQAGRIWDIILALSEPRRTILLCRWLHGMEWAQVAEQVELSVEATKKQHARALIALRPHVQFVR